MFGIRPKDHRTFVAIKPLGGRWRVLQPDYEWTINQYANVFRMPIDPNHFFERYQPPATLVKVDGNVVAQFDQARVLPVVQRYGREVQRIMETDEPPRDTIHEGTY